MKLPVRSNAVIIAAFVAIVGCVIGASKREQPGAIRGNSFELVDEAGVVRARLSCDARGSKLHFLDLEGKPRLVLGFAEGRGSELSVRGKAGEPLALIQCVEDGSTLQVATADGKSKISVEADKNGTRVYFSEGDCVRLKADASAAGARVSAMNKAGEELAAFMEKNESGLVSTKASGSKNRAIMHAAQGNPYFGVFDETGERARLGMIERQPTIIVYDKEKGARFAVTAEDKGTAVSLYDRGRVLRSVMSESNGTGEFTFFGDKQQTLLDLTGGPDGGRLRLFGGRGEGAESVLLGSFASRPKLILNDGGNVREMGVEAGAK